MESYLFSSGNIIYKMFILVIGRLFCLILSISHSITENQSILTKICVNLYDRNSRTKVHFMICCNVKKAHKFSLSWQVIFMCFCFFLPFYYKPTHITQFLLKRSIYYLILKTENRKQWRFFKLLKYQYSKS